MSPDPFPPDESPRSHAEGNVVDPAVLAERRAQRAELAEQVAVRRAADAQALAAELSGERARLEAELEEARREPERLSRLVAERERALRAAEQRAHAEEAQRIETTEQLAERIRRHEAELAELTERSERAEQLAQERAAELNARGARAEQLAQQRERELQELRTRLTEAEQIAAQAESARRRAELKRQSARDKRRRAAEAREQAEAELEAARAEAQAAREGADAVIAQAAHEQRERDRLRAELEQVAAERAALRGELERLRAEHEAEREQARAALDEVRAERERARVAAEEARAAQQRAVAEAQAAADAARAEQQRAVAEAQAAADAARADQERAVAERTRTSVPPAAGGAWVERLRAELACARALAPAPAVRHAVPWPLGAAPAAAAPRSLGDALALERRLLGLRGSGLPGMTVTRAATGARSIESALRQQAGAAGPTAPDGSASTAGLAAGARVAEPGRAVAEGGRVSAPTAARATPMTALALERERSTRLRAQLERQAEIERELREEVAELQRAVASRMDAEQRIERALRRVRGELEAANALRMLTERGSPTRPLTVADAGGADAEGAGAAPGADPATGETRPGDPGGDPATGAPAADAQLGEGPGDAAGRPTPDADASGHELDEPALAGFDADRLNAARARLRAQAPAEETPDAPPAAVPPAAASPEDAPAAETTAAQRAATPAPAPLRLSRTTLAAAAPAEPVGPPTPWLPAALRRLLAEDPDTAGRIVVGMLPAHGLATRRDLVYDLEIADRGTVAVDVRDGRAEVRALDRPRDGERRDFRVAATHAGLARLLLGRRGLRRRARVRGSRRRLKELRRLTQEPLALRDLAASGATLEPALALWLAALAIDPGRTRGHRFTLAHAPHPGGAPDAWLRIRSGAPPQVLRTRPGERPAATLRCTRGALLSLLAGVEPLPGEGGGIDGDVAAVELVREWIRVTEFPSSVRAPRRLGPR